MPVKKECIIRIALPAPLRRLFDYLPPAGYETMELHPGTRVQVPFGRRRYQTGLVFSVTDCSDIAENRLKHIIKFIDQEPVLPKKHLALLEWASNYYHHPIGEVIFNAMPVAMRQGKSIAITRSEYWRITRAGKIADKVVLANAPVQSRLLDLFKEQKHPLADHNIREYSHTGNWRKSLSSLEEKGLIEKCKYNPNDIGINTSAGDIRLNINQKKACHTLLQTFGCYCPYLLDGVTGSGKTEIYMYAIQHVLDAGKQALILLPEIGLTPQLISRFKDRFRARMAVLHSALPDSERLQSWLRARDGDAQIILGTRSAIWTPLHNPGIYIVDEEHDPSYKQQDGFRYSARDIALIRAKRDNTPVILGSATPSMETMSNAISGRYQHLLLPERAGRSILPEIRILDIRGKKMRGPVSEKLLKMIGKQVQDQKQVLLFLNRRGYASSILCHQCGWLAICPRCELAFTYHKFIDKLCCHHCGSQKQLLEVCPDCGNTDPLKAGHGTQRIEEVLQEHLPDAKIVRVDRDTTRRRGSMQAMLDNIHSGNVDILIGTQMLAKGHHFPRVTLVGIIDADRGLFGADFRSSERLAQLLTQVSGRAGRACDTGEVIIQTHFPDHPLLTTLIRDGYGEFSRLLLDERKHAGLPPFSYLALLRGESNDKTSLQKFLDDARAEIESMMHQQMEIFGPVAAPQEKRIGRFRMQLLIQSTNRNALRKVLDPWVLILERLPDSRKVRWSLDVDPQDML